MLCKKLPQELSQISDDDLTKLIYIGRNMFTQPMWVLSLKLRFLRNYPKTILKEYHAWLMVLREIRRRAEGSVYIDWFVKNQELRAAHLKKMLESKFGNLEV